MDYFRQRRAYRNFKQNEADISMGQNNLYRELLDYANDEGKLDDWFPLKNSALIDLTGLSTQGVVKARNGLIQMSLIDYKPGQKNTKKPQYKIIQLYKQTSKSVTTSVTRSVTDGVTKQSKCNNQLQSSVTTGSLEVSQPVVQPVEQTVEHKDLTSTIQELDKDNKYIYQDDLGVYEFIQQAWKERPGGLLKGALGPWIKEWGPELVLHAFKVAFERKVEMDGLNAYVTKVLANWRKEEISTVEDAIRSREEYRAKNQKNFGANRYQNKPVRKEKVPEWMNQANGEEEKVSPEEQAEFERQMQELLGG